MRAKPFLSRELLLVGLLVAAGCRDHTPESSTPDAAPSTHRVSSSAYVALSPFSSLIGDPARHALDAHARLLASLSKGNVSPDDSDYLVFRRALAAGAPLWRRREMLAGEVIFGPLKSVDEAGGALARVDAALVRADHREAREALESIAAPLRLFLETSKTLTFPPSVLAHTLSAAAYDLGSIALESTPAIPDGLSAVLADALGTLDFIEQATEILMVLTPGKNVDPSSAVSPLCLALRKQLESAVQTQSFNARAEFVMQTGRLGSALRQLGKYAGLDMRLPYRPRIAASTNEDDEVVSALTIPARNLSPDDPRSMAFAELGRMLFFDKRLSQGRVRSCASCHVPEKGLADGTDRPRSLDPAVTLRHTPSLLYGSLQAAYLWDGRVLTAERQALGVIHAKAEMGLSNEEIVHVIEGAENLRSQLVALGSPKVTPELVARALAAFQAREFVPADAPIDRFARGEEGALSSLERAGLDVFAGRGRCARCHVPPFFGGSRPRDFAVPVYAVLGVPTKPDGKQLDSDDGRGAVTHRDVDAHAFKTPTVRNIVRTSPYFHHGAYRTLEQVIDFYDRGGGRGLGLSVPNQDPDVRKLGLSAGEKEALSAFLRVALLDATSADKLVGAHRAAH